MQISGTYAFEDLQELCRQGGISAPDGVPDAQIQPASVDLTLDAEVYRLPGSTLPLGDERIRDLIDGLALERLDCAAPLCLARGQVYWVRLRERFDLPAGVEAYTNSKSSIGRIDLATRVLSDRTPRYDRIAAGYRGELWIELIPRSFDVVVRAGDSINQAICFRERDVLDQQRLCQLHHDTPLLYHPDERPVAAHDCLFDGRVVMSADLAGSIIGYEAKRTHRPLVLADIGRHRPEDFFAPLPPSSSGYTYLVKDHFYILATRERVVVPPDLACEMVPYDTAAGEFRAHYAGFFDPGWGWGSGGTKAVLEVRPHGDDLILRHGQPICAMAYERLSRPASELYGHRGNNYASQSGPRLSKHFALDAVA